MNSRVAAIVPAYNEQLTIGNVVKTLVESGVFEEVIVVDDGSQDETAAEAEKNGATLVIRAGKNLGKGEAMSLGVGKTNAEIVCFFDSDLIGLRTKVIQELVSPVLTGRLGMHIGTVDRGSVLNSLALRLPAISGQRALRREIFTGVPPAHINGFGIEVALNYSCRVAHLPMDRIILRGVTVVRKTQKVGWWLGSIGYSGMWWRVVQRWLKVRFDRKSFIHLRKLDYIFTPKSP
jgi:glycosyltransferase involved in cell wall biosynthesis